MTLKSIKSTKSAPPVGPYSPAILVNDFLYISGQIPLKFDGTLVSDNFEEEVHQVLRNIEFLLDEANASWDNVVKVNIFTTDLGKFDIINSIYSQYVSEPYPARAAVEVSALPKGVRIEMEAIAYVK